jgi:hypothetical protein
MIQRDKLFTGVSQKNCLVFCCEIRHKYCKEICSHGLGKWNYMAESRDFEIKTTYKVVQETKMPHMFVRRGCCRIKMFRKGNMGRGTSV